MKTFPDRPMGERYFADAAPGAPEIYNPVFDAVARYIRSEGWSLEADENNPHPQLFQNSVRGEAGFTQLSNKLVALNLQRITDPFERTHVITHEAAHMIDFNQNGSVIVNPTKAQVEELLFGRPLVVFKMEVRAELTNYLVKRQLGFPTQQSIHYLKDFSLIKYFPDFGENLIDASVPFATQASALLLAAIDSRNEEERLAA